MPSFIPALNTVRVALEFTQLGHLAVNVYHVSSPTPIVTADLTAIAGIFVSWWTGSHSDLFADVISFDKVSLRDLTSVDGEIMEYTTGLPAFGGDAGDPFTNNTALAIALRSGIAGRSFRGRSYLAGLSVNIRSGPNGVQAGNVATLVADMAVLNAALIVAGYEMVIASFRHDNAPRANAVLTPVTEFTANTVLDTQRRRLKGVV